jgi:hypothetical protein
MEILRDAKDRTGYRAVTERLDASVEQIDLLPQRSPPRRGPRPPQGPRPPRPPR